MVPTGRHCWPLQGNSILSVCLSVQSSRPSRQAHVGDGGVVSSDDALKHELHPPYACDCIVARPPEGELHRIQANISDRQQ